MAVFQTTTDVISMNIIIINCMAADILSLSDWEMLRNKIRAIGEINLQIGPIISDILVSRKTIDSKLLTWFSR